MEFDLGAFEIDFAGRSYGKNFTMCESMHRSLGAISYHFYISY